MGETNDNQHEGADPLPLDRCPDGRYLPTGLPESGICPILPTARNMIVLYGWPVRGGLSNILIPRRLPPDVSPDGAGDAGSLPHHDDRNLRCASPSLNAPGWLHPSSEQSCCGARAAEATCPAQCSYASPQRGTRRVPAGVPGQLTPGSPRHCIPFSPQTPALRGARADILAASRWPRPPASTPKAFTCSASPSTAHRMQQGRSSSAYGTGASDHLDVTDTLLRPSSLTAPFAPGLARPAARLQDGRQVNEVRGLQWLPRRGCTGSGGGAVG